MTANIDDSLLLFTAERIEEKTGKTWDAWFEILDEINATTLIHTNIARYLYENFELDGWYSQGITVSYERARGLRPKHGDRDGTFAASASKTVPVPIHVLFDAWIQVDQLEAWLGKDVLRLRSNSYRKSARFDILETSAILAVYFTDKGMGKSMVALEEPRLSSKEAVAERKAIWKARFAQMTMHLAGDRV